MNLILIVVFYTLTTGGTFIKSETHYPFKSIALCELIAAKVLTDKLLNTESSYVYSADCVRK